MVVILDTDHLTVIQRRTEPAYSLLREKLTEFRPTAVQTTIVSFEEQMRGWLAVISRSRTQTAQVAAYERLQALLNFFSEIPVAGYSEAAAQDFQQLVNSRLRVGTMDLRIAAIARSLDALLLSANLKDFQRVPSLRVEDWIH
jgi:tRNA(fMet)-specific endonuclease VapC